MIPGICQSITPGISQDLTHLPAHHSWPHTPWPISRSQTAPIDSYQNKNKLLTQIYTKIHEKFNMNKNPKCTKWFRIILGRRSLRSPTSSLLAVVVSPWEVNLRPASSDYIVFTFSIPGTYKIFIAPALALCRLANLMSPFCDSKNQCKYFLHSWCVIVYTSMSWCMCLHENTSV